VRHLIRRVGIPGRCPSDRARDVAGGVAGRGFLLCYRGRNSRLAHLLNAHATEADKTELVAFVVKANEELEKNRLVADTQEPHRKDAETSVGTDDGSGDSYQDRGTGVRTGLFRAFASSSPGSARTVNPFSMKLRSNGLGYNNLLFIATVMLELNARRTALLIVGFCSFEEPEAHLHPQLQTLLADFLSDPRAFTLRPRFQTLVHHPLPDDWAHVSPACLRVLHRGKDGALRCASLGECALGDSQLRQLRRMFDVTKATLLFAKGVILVEGITEALLLPVSWRAARAPKSRTCWVSVVPVCGVDFGSICQLYGGVGLHNSLGGGHRW